MQMQAQMQAQMQQFNMLTRTIQTSFFTCCLLMHFTPEQVSSKAGH